jgi:putative transposase
VLDVLHEPRFADLAPAEVFATLLEEGRYLCSVRTMHRILAENAEARERRDQLRRPSYAKPELLATGPNQLWSWDITKLLGPTKWTYYYLYVIVDVFSRYVVGWMVAHRESAALAEKLIEATCNRQGIFPGQLTLHADNGASMTSKPVAFLLSDLGVTKTHSRPYVSNDNPFSEAQFKTMKYRPDFPQRFGALEHARQHCTDFFIWYNDEHHHEGLGMFRPADVHHGLVEQRVAERQAALNAAFAAHPERFTRGRPFARHPPREVWINKPTVPPPSPKRAESAAPAGDNNDAACRSRGADAPTREPLDALVDHPRSSAAALDAHGAAPLPPAADESRPARDTATTTNPRLAPAELRHALVVTNPARSRARGALAHASEPPSLAPDGTLDPSAPRAREPAPPGPS